MKLDSFEPAIRLVREFFQDQWFDRTRNVRTSGNVSLQAAGLGSERLGDSEFYQPARPHHIRQAIRDVPVEDLSSFSFIDLGSGKGRTLFVAAEFPFNAITGVELSPRLHEQACRNIRRFRCWRRGSRNITAIHANAKEFTFPDGSLVLYMFNPFGRETMREVLEHLSISLRREPRVVVVILLWPCCEDLVAQIEGMQLKQKTREYAIFASLGVKASAPPVSKSA